MRLRLVLTYLLVGLAAILSMIIFVSLDTQRQVRQYMIRGGTVGAEGLVNLLESYYAENGSWSNVETLFRPGVVQQDVMSVTRSRIQLVDPQGKLFYDNDQRGYSLPPFSAQKLKAGIELHNAQGGTAGYLLVDGGGNASGLDATPLLQRLTGAVLRGAGVGLVLALILALLLSERFLRPVTLLTHAAEKLSSGDLDQRVPVLGNDELSTLAITFNGITESLQNSEERRRSMTGDIAHELRAPLTVQRAHLEAMRDGNSSASADNLQTVLDQNELLTRLVEDLRTLAMVDGGELSLDRTWISVPDLVGRVLERFRVVAENRKQRLEAELITAPGEKCPMIWGDSLRLEQVLSNILSNALRYTPEGGFVSLRTSCSAKEVAISVRDSGPGIQPDLLPHVFERFYRADIARKREQVGGGLGLAIARQLAAAHEGSLDAGNHPDGGAIFTLRLPVKQQN